jgi:hypothetical protein
MVMHLIDRITKFANTFEDQANSLQDFLWGTSSKPEDQGKSKAVFSVPGFSRMTQTPGIELQQISQRILSQNRSKPLCSQIPFTYGNQQYMAVIEEHPPGPNNPVPHPGVSLFIGPKSQNLNTNLSRLSERSRKLLQTLDPSFRIKVELLLSKGLSEGLRPEIVESRRTEERQKELYEQGRTTPGQIVTQTLKSKHIDGLAIDIAQLDDKGNITYNASPGFWERMGDIGQELGLEWGGTWKNKDLPHFQWK